MSRLGAIIYAVCLILFGFFSYLAYQLPYFFGDLSISHYLQSLDIPFFDPTMKVISHWLPALIITFLIVVTLWILKKRLEAIFFASLLSSAGLISWLLKELISRPRPGAELVRIWGEGWGQSFPSGHATLAMALGGLLFYLAPRLVKSKATSWGLRSILVVPILLIGTSRVYLGVHWASDVVGGLFLGGLMLYPAIVLYNNYGKGSENARASRG